MHGRYCVAVLCTALLAACARHDAVLDGTAAINESIALVRGANSDTATRELTVSDDSILIAIADEQLTDIKLKIASTDASGKPLNSIEVENHLGGAGIEIAALPVPEGAHVTVTLTGAPDSTKPGNVPLRAQLYSVAAESKPEHSALITAARAWSEATNSGMRPDSFKKNGLANMDLAIARLQLEHGDPARAAEAQLVKAKLLHFYKYDFRESRAAAQRAALAFANLPRPDALNAARANYVEALALIQMSVDGEAVGPAAEDAGKLAQATLEALSTAPALGPIERARAIAAQGQLALTRMQTDAATKGFEQARAIYQAEGYTAGERNMRFSLPLVLIEEGRFEQAASAFDPLLPEIELITDPELRVIAYLAAARGQSFSGRVDEGLALLLKALPMAREYQLEAQQASALEDIGAVYQNRGDYQQAIGLIQQALTIMRAQKDTAEYSIAVGAAAGVARSGGDLDLAFKLANESIRFASTPITRARNHLELALYNRAVGNIPAAIVEYRKGLAVDLGDPRHHAHTDGKYLLASALMDLENNTPKDRAEAASLLAEALDISIAVHDRFRELQVRRVQAQSFLQFGKNAAALAGFNEVLALGEEWRARSSSVEVRASMTKDEQYAFRGLLDIALAKVARRPAGELRPVSPAELAALLRLDRARQRSFGALRVGALDAPTTARVDDLLQQMATKSLAIARLLNQNPGAAHAAELQALQADMSRLHAELDAVRWTAATKNAQVASATHETERWRDLAPGAVQLSYAFGDQHVYAFVRSKFGMLVTALAPTRQSLEEQLAAIAKLDTRTASREIEAALDSVSALLLPTGLLPRESSSVNIVAEGRIASVPFPALRSPTDARRRLIETHEVSMVTTLLGVDEAPRARGSRPFRFVALASGNGTYRAAADVDPMPTLHAARKEIGAAAALFAARDPAAKIKLFTGSDGTAAALRDIWASGADVVHFATHALADLRQPIASLLVLPATDANGKPTYLTAGQVQAWRGDTELVFLSACESAIGPPQYAAGMPGLQRAFLRAGARGVIATLAPIEDVLAQQFAADFYTRYTHGETAARALSETQRAWLTPAPGMSEADQLRRRITALSHAYFAG